MQRRRYSCVEGGLGVDKVRLEWGIATVDMQEETVTIETPTRPREPRLVRKLRRKE